MDYYIKDRCLHCVKCEKQISTSVNDRHACYWNQLKMAPIGMLAMILAGQFDSYNALEKRIAKSIWESKKMDSRPTMVKELKMFGTTNVEVYENWILHGDMAVSK
jgi:hypothetical protein